jgi:hypothetical protein
VTEFLGKNGTESWGDRQGLQQVKVTMREIFTELESHRVKLDKLIEIWEEEQVTNSEEEFLDVHS